MTDVSGIGPSQPRRDQNPHESTGNCGHRPSRHGLIDAREAAANPPYSSTGGVLAENGGVPGSSPGLAIKEVPAIATVSLRRGSVLKR
jgi:hypothetical protein